MKVRLKPGWGKTYATLTVGNVYRVLGVEANDLRIVDDTGGPYLFCPQAFELVDAAQPTSWVSERGSDGELYAYPPELRDPPCFFEELHDGNAQVRQRFGVYVANLCHSEREAEPDPPNSFMRVEWRHDGADDPILLYSELDEQRYEVRKVEKYRDGRATYAWGKGSTGSTALGDRPVPAAEVIAGHPDFEVSAIRYADFEAVWNEALESEDP